MTASTPTTIIVTRHTALVQYLTEIGLAPEGSQVIAHATEDDVRDCRVIGVLPHRLSVHCSSVVEIPLDIPADLRGVELTIEQVRAFAGRPVEYVVRTLNTVDRAFEAITPETMADVARYGGTEASAIEARERAERAIRLIRS